MNINFNIWFCWYYRKHKIDNYYMRGWTINHRLRHRISKSKCVKFRRQRLLFTILLSSFWLLFDLSYYYYYYCCCFYENLWSLGLDTKQTTTIQDTQFTLQYKMRDTILFLTFLKNPRITTKLCFSNIPIEKK